MTRAITFQNFPLLILIPTIIAGCAGMPQKSDLEGYTIEVRRIEARPVLTTRQNIKTADMSAAFATHIPSTWQFASRKGKVNGQPIAIYHQFTEDHVDVEVGVPVEARIDGEGSFRAGMLPGGKVLVTSHFGAYHDLRRAHSAMEAFLEKYSVTRAGPCWEEYVSDPGAVSQDKVRTDVFYPIK